MPSGGDLPPFVDTSAASAAAQPARRRAWLSAVCEWAPRFSAFHAYKRTLQRRLVKGARLYLSKAEARAGKGEDAEERERLAALKLNDMEAYTVRAAARRGEAGCGADGGGGG